jgi:hypothetical protein
VKQVTDVRHDHVLWWSEAEALGERGGGGGEGGERAAGSSRIRCPAIAHAIHLLRVLRASLCSLRAVSSVSQGARTRIARPERLTGTTLD